MLYLNRRTSYGRPREINRLRGYDPDARNSGQAYGLNLNGLSTNSLSLNRNRRSKQKQKR